MIKFLMLTIMIAFGACFDASAQIGQSISDALSYRNVVSSNSVSTSGYRPKASNQSAPKEEAASLPAPKEVDLRNSVTKEINLQPRGEVKVLLPAEEGDESSWEANYNKKALSLLGKKTEQGVNQIRFMQQGSLSSEVYFDKKLPSGKVVENKALYIKVD